MFKGISKKSEIIDLRNHGIKIISSYFVLFFLTNNNLITNYKKNIFITISLKKQVGNSVQRNQIRRRLKSIFYTFRLKFKTYTKILIYSQKQVKYDIISYQELKNDIEKFLLNMEK